MIITMIMIVKIKMIITTIKNIKNNTNVDSDNHQN